MKFFLYLILALCGLISGLFLFSWMDMGKKQKEDFLSRKNGIHIKPYLNRQFGQVGELEILLKKKMIRVEPAGGAYMIWDKEILAATDAKNASHEMEIFFFTPSLEEKILGQMKGKKELPLKVRGYEMVDLSGEPLDSPFKHGLAAERCGVRIAPIHKLVIMEVK